MTSFLTSIKVSLLVSPARVASSTVISLNTVSSGRSETLWRDYILIVVHTKVKHLSIHGLNERRNNYIGYCLFGIVFKHVNHQMINWTIVSSTVYMHTRLIQKEIIKDSKQVIEFLCSVVILLFMDF